MRKCEVHARAASPSIKYAVNSVLRDMWEEVCGCVQVYVGVWGGFVRPGRGMGAERDMHAAYTRSEREGG